MTLQVIDLDLGNWRTVADEIVHARGPVVGVSSLPLPKAAAPVLESLTLTLAPGGPGNCWIDAPDSLSDIEATVAAAPYASALLTDVLGVTSRLPVWRGLVVESLGYSSLLAGSEFAAWRAKTPRRVAPPNHEPVHVARVDDHLIVTLNRPERHNAFSRAVRDDLCAALQIVELDESILRVEWCANGPSFCSGGDLDEFGTSPGIIEAHQIRLERSVGHAIHRLRDRVHPVLHGACFGAGIEIPAFADRVLARSDARFCLPELRMGLIPGAGGTVSIPRRIGTHRTAWLALTGRQIGFEEALAWGLVDGSA